MEHKGVIYILTNPSFPQFVKIGYADDVEERLNQLNRSECIPYAFRLYAYYRVSARLTDMKLHTLIDSLNPNLRSVEEFNGKTRKREFYAMTAAQAYSILEAIAEINGMKENLILVEPTAEDLASEDEAAEIRTRKAPTKYPRMDWMFEQGLVAAGDVLCVYNTGAYNYSMSSNYNRVEKPAMVLVNSAQSDMIVNRESLEDLVAREIIPDRLRKL